MKILVIGGSGAIGSQLVKYFLKNGNVVEYTYLKNIIPNLVGHKLDITQKNSTIDLISKVNPDVVIHTAAVTNVDLCQTNHSLADSIHVEGTANVVEGCKKTKSKLVYISTAFVFDGKKQQYTEEDVMSPTTYSGITKARGEDIVRQASLPYMILRVDQPYGWAEKWQHTNSVLRVIETLQNGKTFKEVRDWYNTPTYIPDFVSATAKLLELDESGVFHLVGSDFISRYDWSLIVCEVFGLDKNLIVPINSTALDLKVKRDNVHLSNEKLFQKTGIRMIGVREGLMKMFSEYRPPV